LPLTERQQYQPYGRLDARTPKSMWDSGMSLSLTNLRRSKAPYFNDAGRDRAFFRLILGKFRTSIGESELCSGLCRHNPSPISHSRTQYRLQWRTSGSQPPIDLIRRSMLIAPPRYSPGICRGCEHGERVTTFLVSGSTRFSSYCLKNTSSSIAIIITQQLG
jgi:hypothetical protein